MFTGRFQLISNAFPLFFLGIFCFYELAAAQQDPTSQIRNGNMEQRDQEPEKETANNPGPPGWRFGDIGRGAKISIETEAPFEGEHSVLIDTLNIENDQTGMSANLSQSLDATPWQGKRVRLRGAVKTADLARSAQAQLWFRVDLPRGNRRPSFGAFDNMVDRPIRLPGWKTYEIVLDVAPTAEKLVLGMFVIGRGKFWLDDVILEEVTEDIATTGRPPRTPASQANKSDPRKATGPGENRKSSDSKKAKQSTSRFRMSPLVAEAMAQAENAPQQPFWNHWLWLGVAALVLFLLSARPARMVEFVDNRGGYTQRSVMGWVPKFAFRFSLIYWVLYSFPRPLNSLSYYLGKPISTWMQSFFSWYNQKVNQGVTWVAENVFKIQHELVPPNGSGDTTYNYVQVFSIFCVAFGLAWVWSLIDWRRTDYRILKDLLRSYLRYVLAVTMLSYGLAKLGWDSNQFPELGEQRLGRTWGESSPMGVLWSFMGASRPYTMFAGLGEVIGGLLLLFRRTTLLGSLVVLGVMINVMMLNFCYDVPVKLYSTHLVCMAIYLMLPDAGRILNLLVWNRPAPPTEMQPPYTNRVTIWIQRVIKAALIVLLVGIPLYQHIDRQRTYFAEQTEIPEFFGSFDVTTRDDGETEPEGPIAGWKTVKFERLAYNQKMERVRTNWMTVVTDTGRLMTTFVFTDDEIQLDEHQYPGLPKEKLTLRKTESGWNLQGEIDGSEFEVSLTPQSGSSHRLKTRGFRWINEVPFNR